MDPEHRAEILGHATFLRGIVQRIRAGFSRSVPIADPGYPYWKYVARDPCGVIEVQSGVGDFQGSFFPGYWWRDEIETSYSKVFPQPETYKQYLGWHEHGVETRYWRLYDSLGLFALWSIIPDVQTAAKGRPGAVAKRGKAALEIVKYVDLVGQTGAARARLDAFTRWSTETSITRPGSEVDDGPVPEPGR